MSPDTSVTYVPGPDPEVWAWRVEHPPPSFPFSPNRIALDA